MVVDVAGGEDEEEEKKKEGIDGGLRHVISDTGTRRAVCAGGSFGGQSPGSSRSGLSDLGVTGCESQFPWWQ